VGTGDKEILYRSDLVVDKRFTGGGNVPPGCGDGGEEPAPS